ncbi:magnesium transporter ApaG [Lampropedia cohaerens]|uniref:Protein ApaG n=1 Tax=Lampropedia cohaerens TaxID=1610491 RepID=A0A0U1Q3H0_9BURK|nr:Co2+/Mg2+ efflux protein ApaG [Lampropedia cohaerens]KKW69185.1 magnesium transporter ApaG [Lampropedia cohaerens]
MSENTFHVDVRAQYLPQQSNPAQREWRFAYRIRIANHGTEAAQLIARFWRIEDADGHVEQVRGLGVVGEQPLLQPGEHYEYTSGCQLRTPTGTMQGHYLCVTAQGEPFECPIEPFVLSADVCSAADILHAVGTTRVLH